MKEISVFDIIGPNMIGPSSSHTAGALRIAKLARHMVKESINKVTFILYGSFARTYQGHGTDRALVAGILGFDTEDHRIKDSFAIAKEEGLDFEFNINEKRQVDHPNTVDIIMEEDKGEVIQLTGVSIGGGRAVIKNINGVEVDLTGEYHTLVIRHKDLPGVVAKVTKILSTFDINIAFMKLYRENKGTTAYSIIEADEPMNEEVIQQIEEFYNVSKAILIEKESI